MSRSSLLSRIADVRRIDVPHGPAGLVRYAVVLLAMLAPASAPAQTPASSFDDLPRILKEGQTVFIRDDAGRETRGKVADVSADFLSITTPAQRTFRRDSIATISETDRLQNGALIGSGIATGFAVWDYLIDPSEPGNAVVFAVAIGLGSAIGAGIDALISRPGRVLYRSGRRIPSVVISLPVERDRRGVLISVRF